jgi:hypothetical protein
MTIVETRPTALPVFKGSQRTAAATFLILGPVTMLLSALVAVAADSVAGTANDGAVAASAPTLTAIGSILDWITVPTMLAWGVVLLLIARPWSRRLAWTGFTAMTLQLCALATVVGVELVRNVLVQQGTLNADVAEQVTDSGLTASAAGLFLFIVFIPTEIIGLIVLGIALWRTRWVPRWIALLFMAFPFIDFLVNDTRWLSALAFGVFLTANATLAARALRDGAPRPENAEHTV